MLPIGLYFKLEGDKWIATLPDYRESERDRNAQELAARERVIGVLESCAEVRMDLASHSRLRRPAIEFAIRPFRDGWGYLMGNLGDMWPSHFLFLRAVMENQDGLLQGNAAYAFLKQFYHRFLEHHPRVFPDHEEAPLETQVRYCATQRKLFLKCPRYTGILIGKEGVHIRSVQQAFRSVGVKVEVDSIKPVMVDEARTLQVARLLVETGCRVTSRVERTGGAHWEYSLWDVCRRVDPARGAGNSSEVRHTLAWMIEVCVGVEALHERYPDNDLLDEMAGLTDRLSAE